MNHPLVAPTQLEARPSSAWKPLSLAAAVGVGMFVVGAGLSLLRVRHLLAWSYDLGFYIQNLFAIRAGLWSNTIYGFGVFSDHVSPILVPLAWVVPASAPGEALVIIQSLAIGSAVFPVAKLGAEIAGKRGSVIACVWYAGSAAIWHALMYDFHPVTLALPFGVWVLLEIERREEGRPWIPLLAMPLIREDVALLYGVVVLVAGWRQLRRSWQVMGSLVALVGIAYMFLMRVQPGIGNHLWYRYQFDGIGQLLSRPLRVDLLIGLAAVLGPFLVVPVLRGWRRSWPGLLLLASFAVSSWSNQVSLYYQYYAQVVPFLIAGAISCFALPRWSQRIQLSLIATVLLGLLLGPFFYIGFGPPDRYASEILSSSGRVEARGLLTEIPGFASVSATEMLTPAVAWRPEIHPFPGPMMCGNSIGYFTPRTRAVDYVLFEMENAPSGVEWSSTLMAWGFVLERRAAGIELWRLDSNNVAAEDCPSWEQQKRASLGD